MLQPIFDFIYAFWGAIFESWWYIVDSYTEGVIMRFGNFNRLSTSKNGVFETGLHFKWPLVEEYLSKTIVTTTMDIDSQSLVTKDQKSIVVSTVVKYRITDVKLFLLEITDQYSAIQDITMSKTREVVSDKTWDEICDSTNIDSAVAEKVRYEVKKYGVTIEPKGVTFKDLQACRSLRLLQDTQPAISINNEG